MKLYEGILDKAKRREYLNRARYLVKYCNNPKSASDCLALTVFYIEAGMTPAAYIIKYGGKHV